MTLGVIVFFIVCSMFSKYKSVGYDVGGDQADNVPNKCWYHRGRLECGYRLYAGIRRPPVYDLRAIPVTQRLQSRIASDIESPNLNDKDPDAREEILNSMEKFPGGKIIQEKLLVDKKRVLQGPKTIITTSPPSCVKLLRKILGDMYKQLPYC